MAATVHSGTIGRSTNDRWKVHNKRSRTQSRARPWSARPSAAHPHAWCCSGDRHEKTGSFRNKLREKRRHRRLELSLVTIQRGAVERVPPALASCTGATSMSSGKTQRSGISRTRWQRSEKACWETWRTTGPGGSGTAAQTRLGPPK